MFVLLLHLVVAANSEIRGDFVGVKRLKPQYVQERYQIRSQRKLPALRFPPSLANVVIKGYPALRVAGVLARTSDISIGPMANCPSSVRRVRSRRYPPAELICPPRSKMQAITVAAFSGPIVEQASWYADGLTPSMDRTTTRHSSGHANC